MSDEPERFVDHPTPDRFFQQIEPADIEMQPMEHDDVTFKSQLVPGGTFSVELTAKYTYAGRDCSQHLSLNRAAAESLYERLGEVLQADTRGHEGFVVEGQSAAVDAVVTVDGDRYVLARTRDKAVAVKHRHIPNRELEEIANDENAGVYDIDE